MQKVNSPLPERHRILIVDDDAPDRQAVAQALRREAAQIEGIEADVREAETIAQAREALSREEYACVFADHSLPDGTALDLLMELRAQGLATPVIVLTGRRDEEAILEVMRAGAADYLPKERLHPDLVARSLRASLRFLQAQREKQAVLDELRARDRAIAAASNGIVIADPRRPDSPLVYTNGAFLSMTGYAEDEVIGRNCRFLQGPDTDPSAVQEIREAVRLERPCQVLILNYRKDGTAFWNEVTVSPVRDARGALTHFVGIQTDVTARKLAEAERGRAEAALRRRAARERFLAELTERSRRLSDPDDVIADAVSSVGEFLGVSRCVFADIDVEADVCTIPVNFRADASVMSMAGAFPISAFGPFLVAEYQAGRTVAVDDVRLEPVRVPPAYRSAYEAVACGAFVAAPVLHSDRLVSVIAVHSPTPRRWEPEEVELLRTVVERTWLTVEVLRQGRARAREADELREAHRRTARILESITDAFIALDTEWHFTHVNDQAELFVARKREGMLGRSLWEVFPEALGSPFERQFRRAVGEGVTVSFEEFFPPLRAWFEVRAYPSEDGLSIFFRNVSERKRVEAERERLLAEQRARAERETVLNRIGQTIRSASDPEAVQEAAVSLLGEALAADRCYFAVYDLGRGGVTVTSDWCRAGLPSIRGVYPFTNTSEMFLELYHGTDTSVIRDSHTAPLSARTRANMDGLGLRARVSVALADGEGLMATLTAAMAGGPRDWTAEEVALVEAVATQLQVGVEAARVQKREHRIATQLQDALLPVIPPRVPGLKLGYYYRAALEEAGVGGDFAQVFSADKGVSYLVVGDLAGKGLAAASQIAIVTNMLRFAVRNGGTLAGAVGELNTALADDGLLSGFATLFVGRYDAGTRALTFVNCGQDAGLILRGSTGETEPLPPTGPVLGMLGGAEYTEEVVTLKEGDILALFTDGLTEAGPTRAALLTGEGVAGLLRSLPGVRDPQAVVERLMAGVDAYAGQGVRDDQCLLVGTVEGAPA